MDKPKHLIIIGGGPIGIEMAQAHMRLGCKVSAIDMAKILPRDDQQNVAILYDILIHEGIALHEKATVKSVHHTKKTVSVEIKKGRKTETIKGSHLLVAAGRTPNIDGLGLDKAGIETNKSGVDVDDHLKTTNKHVYAIGDVAGGPQFTHVAGYHAGLIIRQICFGLFWTKVNYSALPWVTYTDPELAQVGLTHKAAIEKHGEDEIKVVESLLTDNDRAIAERNTNGQLRVITNNKGVILGASMIGAQAGEIIQLWGLAISKNMKVGDVAGMISPYPTMMEINKRAAGAWFKPQLFSDKTRAIVKYLKYLG